MQTFNPAVSVGSISSTDTQQSYLQSSALQDITTTPAHTAASAVQPARTKESLDRITACPAPETQPLTLMAPLTSCNVKVCVSAHIHAFETCTVHLKVNTAVILNSVTNISPGCTKTKTIWHVCVALQTDNAEESWEILLVTSNPPTIRGTTQPMSSAPGLSTHRPNAGSLSSSQKSTCLLRMSAETT